MKPIYRQLTIALLAAGLTVLASWQLVISGSAQVQSGQELAAKSGLNAAQEAALKEMQRRARLEKKADSLMVKAREEGTVRVIVHPRGDFKLDPTQLGQRRGQIPGLVSEDVLQVRRARITTARENLLNKMQPLARGTVKSYSHVPFVAFDVDEEGLKQLRASSEVEFIEEDVMAAPTLSQSTALIGATTVWNSGFTGAGFSVAIADTGVDKNHPLLIGKVVKEACFSTASWDTLTACPNGLEEQHGSGAATPIDPHGTHVASIAAGHTGVAKGAKIVAIQVFSKVFNPAKCKEDGIPCVRSNTSDQIAAAAFVFDNYYEHKIAALNFSLGSGVYPGDCTMVDSDTLGLANEIGQLNNMGVPTVIASGNDSNKLGISRPACIGAAVSVGASSKADVVASFSNSGPTLDLLAPGVDITAAIPGGGLASWNGTSMAAPHVAGAFALLKSKADGAAVSTMLNLLKTTGKPLVDSAIPYPTKPRINVAAAVSSFCSVTMLPGSKNLDGFGGTFNINMTVPSQEYCEAWTKWTATKSASWLHILSPTTGTGNATIQVKADTYYTPPGQGMKTRVGYVYVNGKSFKVTQVSES